MSTFFGGFFEVKREYKPSGLSGDACNASPLISEPALRARRGYQFSVPPRGRKE
jgi:hypothetical protein